MSPSIANTLASAGQLLESSNVTMAKAGTSRFEGVRTHAESQADQTLARITSHQVSQGTNELPQVNLVQSSPAAILGPKVEQVGNSLATLSNRVAAVGGSNSTGPLRGRLESLESQFLQVGSRIKTAGAQTNSMQLLKLQHEIYQLDEEVEVLSKVVEQAANGVKSVLQTQL